MIEILISILCIITFTIIIYLILGIYFDICSNTRIHPNNNIVNEELIIKNNNIP
jgi:hypothetical protein